MKKGKDSMNQEKIGKIIKDIRQKAGLSQQKFAEKYGVTFQAVSKWENGKNIPDLAILKNICEDNNLDLNKLLDAKNRKKQYSFLIPILLVMILALGIFIFYKGKSDKDFEFKQLSTTCKDFELSGSIAYNDNKSSIYISNISYCGKEDNTVYDLINCTLYEAHDKTKSEVSKCNYMRNSKISLEEFLKNVSFNIDNYEQTCKDYKENSLELEIDAIDNIGNHTTYKIPLSLNDNCRE